MNYLSRNARVIRDPNGRVRQVIAIWQGQEIPFTITSNGTVLRADYDNTRRPVIPAEDYQKMHRQVTSVFAHNRAMDRAEEFAWLINDLNRCGVFLKASGRLAITRWEKPAGQKPKLIRQTVDDLAAAIRMQDHILSNYSLATEQSPAELDQLESIEEVLLQANQLLLRWSQADETAKNELQKQLACIILRLENCRNESKVAAREQAEKVLPLKDSLDRPNPMAFAARTTAALGDLAQRIEELHIIMPYIAMRKQLLLLADRWLRSKFNQAAGLITQVARHQVFRNGRIAAYEPKFIWQRIDRAIALLDNAIISPYYQLAQRIRTELKSAKNLFRRKDYQASRQKLDSARELLPVANQSTF